jgi:hypothetical protein
VSTRRCEGPAFTKCRAVTDLDRDTAPILVQFHPERIGFIEDERLIRVIMRSEYSTIRPPRKHDRSCRSLRPDEIRGQEIFPALQPNSSPADHPIHQSNAGPVEDSPCPPLDRLAVARWSSHLGLTLIEPFAVRQNTRSLNSVKERGSTELYALNYQLLHTLNFPARPLSPGKHSQLSSKWSQTIDSKLLSPLHW